MCGAFGINQNSSLIKILLEALHISTEIESDLNIRPNARIPISIGQGGQATGVEANWWLFQKRTETGFTYHNQWRSFNTRKDKLFSNRQADFSYRRCVIPASCFYEWKGNRYKIEPVDKAIAFGGLYKVWHAGDEPPHYSCSIITLPPHPKLCHIHDKSIPLMLLPEEITPWLDDSFHNPNYWLPTLETKIRFDLRVTPVDKKEPGKEIGESEIIPAD
ncbi:SOS response-associated peptidase family protein [Aliikangiella coralliicola]|uniref:Abasic site processing protein n=1 Tax=Aliikangiella coralliicola TaxID=2592383 RepID=A0A545U7H4_9GAMM|nr:SOS response-associated peptidase family protein [Aliikangiella coralliicola]TQV85414.1 SOS response-associated peptidase [Aliikangiella coralliicola]